MLKDIIKAAFTVAALTSGAAFLTDAYVKGMFLKEFGKAALLIGLNAITAKGANNTSGKNLGIKQAGVNSIAPRNVVYGKTRVGGTIVQRSVSGNSNTKLHHVIALAGHEINDIKKIFIDGGKGLVELDLSSDFTTATENGETVYRVTSSTFQNDENPEAYTDGSLIKLTFEKGDQTTANGYAQAQIGSDWTADHKLQGIAYVYINCIADKEKFPSYPTFSFEVEGKKVYDPVTATTVYSTNPALIIRDYLMDATYGFGAISSEINDATTGAGFVKARSDCNDSVTITGGTESRYTLNGQFDSTEEPQQVLQHMLSACAGQLLYNNGKFSLFVGKERTASGTITDDKLLAPISITTKASGQDLANGVKATYVRPSDNYIAAEITPYQDSTYLTADTPSGEQSADYENYMDLSFPYTQSTFTAQRLARISLDYQRQDQTLTAIVPLEFMTHQVGDIINFTNDRLGYSGKDFEIVAMGFEFIGDNYLALRLNLKEYAGSVFDNITYVADPTLPSAPSAGDNTVGTPTGLTLSESSKNTTAKEIYVKASWTNDDDDKIVATEVAFKKSTDSEFSSNYTSYPRTTFTFRAESSTTYNFKVRHISSTGVAGDYTSVVNITTSADVGTFTDGTIAGITVATDKLYEGTGTFNNSNTGFYLDNTGQFSLKDKLSFDGTTLNISGNLTVENTITADKIVVDGINLDNLISATTQSGSIYLTEFTGIKIATAGASNGYPALLRMQDDQGTNCFTDITQSQTGINIRARANTAQGTIRFQGIGSGITPVNYGGFDASGNFEIGTTDVIDASRNLLNLESINMADNKRIFFGNSGDFGIKHDGFHTYIQNATGHVYFQQLADDNDIIFQSDNGSGGVTPYLTIDGSASLTKFNINTKHLDSVKATFGDSADLEIYHNGTDSFIDDAGSGDLRIRSSFVKIEKYTGETMATFNDDNSVALYFNNSKKFETTSTGIDVTGNATISGDLTVNGTTTTLNTATLDVEDKNITLNYSTGDSSASANGAGITIQDAVNSTTDATILWDATNDEFDFSHPINVTGALTSTSASFNGDVTFIGAGSDMTWDNSADKLNFDDNTKATFGNSDDLQIYHDGSNSYIKDAGTGTLRILSDDVRIMNAAGTEISAQFIQDGEARLKYDNSTKLATTSTGIDVTGTAVVDGLTSSGQLYVNTGDGVGSSGGIRLREGSNQSHRIYPDNQYQYNSIGSSDPNWIWLQEGGSQNARLYDTGFDLKQGAYQINGTTVIDSSRNLVNIGTISATSTATIGGKTTISTATDEALVLNSTDNGPIYMAYKRSNDRHAYVGFGGGSDQFTINNEETAGTMVLATAGITALTIDSSQDVTFAGDIDLADAKKIKLGASDDLQIYHDATDSYITNDTGNLEIRNNTNDGDINFRSDNGSGGLTTYFAIDGGGEYNRFYKNAYFTDNVKALFGSSSDLQIYHNGSHSYIEDAGTGNLYIRGDNTIDIRRQVNGEQYITAVANGAVTLFYDGTSKLATTSTGVKVTGDIALTGSIQNTTVPAEASVKINENGYNDGTTYFRDLDIFDGKGNQFVKFDGSTQKVGIGTTAPRHKLSVNGTLGSSVFSGFGLGVVGGLATAESGTPNAAIGLQCANASSSKIFAYDYSGSAGIPISIQPDNANVYICSGGGSVGIGTTSPSSVLDVAGSAAVLTITDTRNQSFSVGDVMSSLAFDSDDTSGGSGSASHPRATISLKAENTFGSVTGLAFATKGDTSSAAVERMRITSGGTVGIGTTSPASSQKLDVAGKIRASQDITITNGDLIVNTESKGIRMLSANGTEYLVFVNNSGQLVVEEQ
jgi:hypothetical protein